jgi:hypothetical protein
MKLAIMTLHVLIIFDRPFTSDVSTPQEDEDLNFPRPPLQTAVKCYTV